MAARHDLPKIEDPSPRGLLGTTGARVGLGAAGTIAAVAATATAPLSFPILGTIGAIAAVSIGTIGGRMAQVSANREGVTASDPSFINKGFLRGAGNGLLLASAITLAATGLGAAFPAAGALTSAASFMATNLATIAAATAGVFGFGGAISRRNEMKQEVQIAERTAQQQNISLMREQGLSLELAQAQGMGTQQAQKNQITAEDMALLEARMRGGNGQHANHAANIAAAREQAELAGAEQNR